jgi:hypothetical protein
MVRHDFAGSLGAMANRQVRCSQGERSCSAARCPNEAPPHTHTDEAEMDPITRLLDAGLPLHALILAINHFVSTGDHIGEGGVYEDAGMYQVAVPVKQYLPLDRADFSKFRSRFKQVAPRFGIRLELVDYSNGMDIYAFKVAPAQVPALARALAAEPGKLGWGSTKPYVDRYAAGMLCPA